MTPAQMRDAAVEIVERHKAYWEDAASEIRAIPLSDTAPGRTDLVIPPENIDAFMAVNPFPPDPSPPRDRGKMVKPLPGAPCGGYPGTNPAPVIDAETLAKVRAALEWYADIPKYIAPFTSGMGDLWLDCGRTAHAALAALDRQGGG